MIAPRALLGAVALLLLLALARANKNETARAIKKQTQVARKNGCIIALYVEGQRPWPSSRRNRPLTTYTVFKNRGSTAYENVFLRYYKRPEATFVPAWTNFPLPVDNPPQFRAKPAQPQAQLLPDLAVGDPNLYPFSPYFYYGPLTIPPGTTKIGWRFQLPNCAGPQKFNVTLGLPNPAVPITCLFQEFGMKNPHPEKCT